MTKVPTLVLAAPFMEMTLEKSSSHNRFPSILSMNIFSQVTSIKIRSNLGNNALDIESTPRDALRKKNKEGWKEGKKGGKKKDRKKVRNKKERMESWKKEGRK